MTAPDAPVHYEVTRIDMINIVRDLDPPGRTTSLGVLASIADLTLARLPEAPGPKS